MARICLSILNLLNILLLLFASSSLLVHSTEVEGCSASPLLPDRPFIVVWNHPTSGCENKGIHLDFDRWGIIDNTRDRFFGQQIVLFYNLGKWPYFDSKNQPVNGGLPQLSDIQAHLTKVDDDLKTSVWNKTFGGLGVIDMEHWRPLYWTNYDSHSIYQRKSLALAKQRFPNYNKTQVLAEAIKEFNKAARDFMSQTLQRTISKRPDGKWGYYLFPQCFDATCNVSTIRNNDRINWLFQESSALYPSIYFTLATPKSSVSNRIKQTLHEAFRVKAKYSPQNIPILPYSKSQEGPYKMYQKLDLSLAILQPANMGASGVVIWGSSRNAAAKNECLILQDYIDNVLGPYVRNVSYYFGNCSQKLCNGHGRCVRKDYERIYQTHLYESGRTDCLIPKESLRDSKRNDNNSRVATAAVDSFIGRRDSQTKGYRNKSKVERLIENIKKYFDFNSKNEFHNSFGVRGRNKIRKRSSNSVIHFNIETDIESTRDSAKPVQTGNEVPLFTHKPNENPAVDTNGSGPVDDVDAYSNNPTFNTNAPSYDFDDYVCKCYAGFTGIHCDNKSF